MTPAPETQTTLDLLLGDAVAEMEAVQTGAVDDLAVFPLEANAEVLRDTSVWACKQASSCRLSSIGADDGANTFQGLLPCHQS